MITTEKVISRIEILENRAIQIRESTYFVEDGKRISEPQHHRTAILPGMDTKGYDKLVVDIANLIWTPEIVAAFKAQQEADIERLKTQLVPRG